MLLCPMHKESETEQKQGWEQNSPALGNLESTEGYPKGLEDDFSRIAADLSLSKDSQVTVYVLL